MVDIEPVKTIIEGIRGGKTHLNVLEARISLFTFQVTVPYSDSPLPLVGKLFGVNGSSSLRRIKPEGELEYPILYKQLDDPETILSLITKENLVYSRADSKHLKQFLHYVSSRGFNRVYRELLKRNQKLNAARSIEY